MAADNEIKSTNFGFLAEHDTLFVHLASAPERAFSSDLNTIFIKLRQLGEAIAQSLAPCSGVEFDRQTSQFEFLYRLNRELRLDLTVRRMFRALRGEGNNRAYRNKGEQLSTHKSERQSK